MPEEDIKQVEQVDSIVEHEDIIEITEEMLKADEERIQLDLENYRKKKLLESLEVDTNGIPFNADRVAIGNMSAVTSIANYKFINALEPTFKMVASTQQDEGAKAIFEGIGSVIEQVYTAVYKTKIDWKGADNKVHSVQAETVIESLEKAMKELASVVAKK